MMLILLNIIRRNYLNVEKIIGSNQFTQPLQHPIIDNHSSLTYNVPHTHMSLTEDEVLIEKRRLSSLIEDTKAAIGDVAKQGFEKLNQLPEDPDNSHNLPNHDNHGGRPPFFQQRRIVRATEIPTEPVVLGNGEFTIITTATELLRRQHKFPSTGITIPLFTQDRRVAVDFRGPNDTYDDYGHMRRNMAISARGDVAINHTRLGFQPSINFAASGYPNAHVLRSDYARCHTERLVTAQFVGEVLHRVHGLRIDTRELRNLQASWHKVGSISLDPNIAALLPKKPR